MESILLKTIAKNNGTIYYEFEVSDRLTPFFNKTSFEIEYDQNMEGVPDDILTIPFVSLMLPISWILDAIIWVKELDQTFYYATFQIKRAYQAFYPKFDFLGTVVPGTIKNNSIDSGKSVLLFSGGVDSITTYIRVKETMPTLLNVYGWRNSSIMSNSAYKNDCAKISAFAEREHVSAHFCISDFATLFSTAFSSIVKKRLHNTFWYGFQHSMAFISFAIPYAVLFGISDIYIASSNTMGYRRACASDPTTDIEFRFAGNGKTIHDGFELTRQDKIHLIVEYQKSIQRPFPLQVCSFKDYNCCKCEKCFRTILGLAAENATISDFGFFINEELLPYFKRLISENAQFLGLEFEHDVYWSSIRARMMENYDSLKEKAFVDWFLNTDFISLRKKAIRNYRTKNFFPLLKKRLQPHKDE